MLMQAFRNADTAMEQITAVRELIKLHGVQAPVKVEHEHTHTHELQLENMPLKELMKLANQNNLTLEGEFERVADRKPVRAFLSKSNKLHRSMASFFLVMPKLPKSK